jgi:hypothetical protein
MRFSLLCALVCANFVWHHPILGARTLCSTAVTQAEGDRDDFAEALRMVERQRRETHGHTHTETRALRSLCVSLSVPARATATCRGSGPFLPLPLFPSPSLFRCPQVCKQTHPSPYASMPASCTHSVTHSRTHTYRYAKQDTCTLRTRTQPRPDLP